MKRRPGSRIDQRKAARGLSSQGTRGRMVASSVVLAFLAAACALVAAGCGSTSSASPPASGTTTTTPGTSTAPNGFAAYTQCLSQHGVTLGGFRRGATGAGGFRPGATGPGGFRRGATGPGGFRRGPSGGFGPASRTPAQQKAFAACASLRPTGGFGGRGFGPGGAGGAANANAFATFQACLKKHGVQLGGAGQNSSATQSAIAACRKVLPNAGVAPTTTTTTTTSG